MRLTATLLAIVFLNACGAPEAKPAKAAKGKGGAMSQRVLYAPAPVSDAVRAAKPDFLGKTPKGAWFAVEDAAALTLKKDDKSIQLLYPSRAEYDEAMQGLDDGQKTEAVEWRLKVWTSRIRDEALPALYEGEKEVLAQIARASRSGKGSDYFKQAFKDDLDVFDQAIFEERYQSWEMRDLLTAVFEGLNNLNRDVERLQDVFKDKVPAISPALLESRKALALTTQKAMQKYGLHQGITPNGSVHVSFERGVYIVPKHAPLAKELEDDEWPVQEWKEGLVSVWMDWDLQNLANISKQYTILYLDINDFRHDFSRLTPAQRARRFAARVAGVGMPEVAIHLADQQLALALIHRRIGPMVAAKEAGVAAEIAKSAPLEIEALRETLAARGGWARVEAADAPVSVLAQAERALTDAVFWRNWGLASNWDGVMEALEKVVAIKRKQVDALRASGQG